MQRIVITGPESSGKTTLARKLAAEFGTVWVPEYARIYLSARRELAYTLDDLAEIAKGQAALLHSVVQSQGEQDFLFLDTWMLEMRIWAEYRFGSVPQIIEDLQRDIPPHCYLLCTPDLEWEDDPLRENPDDRDALFRSYETYVSGSNIPYFIITGTGISRERDAIGNVRRFLGNLAAS